VAASRDAAAYVTELEQLYEDVTARSGQSGPR
jgi:hypothetical protein